MWLHMGCLVTKSYDYKVFGLHDLPHKLLAPPFTRYNGNGRRPTVQSQR